MKKLAVTIGIIVLTGIIAYPAFAHGPRWGRGGGGKGYWGGGPGSCWQDARGPGNFLYTEQGVQNWDNQPHYEQDRSHAPLRRDFSPNMKSFVPGAGYGHMGGPGMGRWR